MKIPKQFMIKGKLWKVEYRWRLHDEDHGHCHGLCEFDTNTILIDRLLSKDLKWETFLHELTHAIMHEAHLHEAGGLDGFAEEVVCSSVAAVFSDLFLFRLKPKKQS